MPSPDSLFTIQTTRWIGQLDVSADAVQVVAVANAYIAAWSQAECTLLPSKLLLKPLVSEQDVSEYAVALTQAQLAFNGSLVREVALEQVSLFFSSAATRLARLAHISRVRV